jgi:membrane protein involved in colicin uptake
LAAKGSLFIEAQVRVIQAKAEAELKAMQEAEAKAAAEQKAKREADAKAAAEQKAKREADAKAAAEQKAKQVAEAKAAADKAAEEKIISDAKAEAGRIFMLTKAAAKKTTISCVKGKLTKKVTAVKPLCPSGYKKKA